MKLKEIKEIAKEIKNKKTVIVCYSTGVDSTLLLYLVKEAFDTLSKEEQEKINIRPVYFFHGENKISTKANEAIDLAIATCKKLNLSLDIYDLKLEKNNLGWEGVARRKREEIIKDIKPDLVFTGHHRMDRVENIMIQLFRGAGRGITGIKKRDGLYYRPLIAWEKNRIYNYAKKFNLQWREDPTNQQSEMTRNFWRNQVIPLLKTHYSGLDEKIINISQKIQLQQNLNHDLALIDGLNKLNAGEEVDISTLSKPRVFNLIKHYGYVNNKGIEQNQLEEAYKRWVAGHDWSIKVGDKYINCDKNKLKTSNQKFLLDKKIKQKNNSISDKKKSKLSP